MAIAAFPVRGTFRDIMLLILKIKQGGKARGGLQEDIPSVPAVAAVRAASGDVFLPSETAHAISSVSCLHVDLDLIDKHGFCLNDPLALCYRQYKSRQVNYQSSA